METRIAAKPLAKGTALLVRQLLVGSNQSLAIEQGLIDRAELVRTVSGSKQVPVTMIGAAPLFENVILVTDTAPNWVFYNLSFDPLWQSGSFPIPRQHLRSLWRLYRAGVEFDALYVAHELPPGFDHTSDPLGFELIEPSPPREAVRLAGRIGRATDVILSVCSATLTKPARVLGSTGNRLLTTLRDPVLLGAVVEPGLNPENGTLAIWFLLAAWRW